MLSRKPGTLQKLKLHFYHGICACFGAGGAEKNKGVRSFTPKIKNREKNTCSPKNTADQNLLVLKILRKEKKTHGHCWFFCSHLLPCNSVWWETIIEEYHAWSAPPRCGPQLCWLLDETDAPKDFHRCCEVEIPRRKKKTLVEHTSVGNRPCNQNLQMST